MSVNLRSALLMIVAMLMFAIEDALIKQLTGAIAPSQVLSLIGVGGALVFSVWFVATGQRVWVKAFWSKDVMARSACEMCGVMAFVTALSLIPLTTASAVIQATPLVVASGAALFLGNHVGWRRWLAIGVGFAGVLLIIRPVGDSFQSATLLAVLGMLFLAARDLITRSLKTEIDGVHLSFHAYVAVTLSGFLLIPFEDRVWVWPSVTDWMWIGAAIIVSIFAYLTIVAATRVGDAALTSSFRYSRMLFALIIGAAFFGERPDMFTYIGIFIVISAGLFTLVREARLARSGQSV